MCRASEADPWRVYRWTRRAARKSHICYDCGRTIAAGERYHWATGLHDDNPRGWEVFKLCAHCDAASEWLMVMCNGYLYGGIGEELREHWDEEYSTRSPGLGRLVLGHERRWQRTKHATGLMEIPTWAGQCARDTLAA